MGSTSSAESVDNINNVTVESPIYAKCEEYNSGTHSYETHYYRRVTNQVWNYVQYTTKNPEGDGTITYTWNPTTMTDVDNGGNLAREAFEEFQKQLSIPGLWNLHQDGVGNLGGNGLYWDMEGNLTVSGNIEAKSGTIGGFKIS